MEDAVAVFLAVWLLLSLLNQFPLAVARAIRSRDACHLLPRWHFFAPRPAIFDFQFVVRLFTADHQLLQEWKPIPIPRRTPLSALWNPVRRLSKLRTDATQMLTVIAAELDTDSQRRILLTVPYLLLLNHACRVSRHDDAAFVQFAVLRTHGFEPDQLQTVLLRSELHSIDAGRNDPNRLHP